MAGEWPGAGWNPTKWIALRPQPLEPLPAQVVLAVPADVEIDQAVAGLQAEPFPELVAAVAARGHDHADLDDGGHAGHPQRGLGPEQGGGLAIGVAELGDQAGRLAADPPGVRGVDIGPGEVGQEEPGDPRPPRGDQGDGGASQRTAAVPSSRSFCASSSTRAIASAWTWAASARVAAPSVALLSPGGLSAPTSETCGSSAAGRRSRSRQWSNRLGWQRIVTGISGGIRLITATERVRWPNP